MSLVSRIMAKVSGRKKHNPSRETTAFPALSMIGQPQNMRKFLYKPTPRNLRYFSKTVYASRAINAIKNPIIEAPWEVRPKQGVEHNSEIDRQIAAVTASLESPNPEESFRTMMEAVITDILCGAGAIEQQLTGDPKKPVALFSVDGLSIQIYPGWSGDKNEPRYAQTVGYGGLGGIQGNNTAVQLLNEDLVYFRPNPSTNSPFGTGPLEIAFQSIARKLGVEEYAGNVAGNASPSMIVHLGENVDAATVSAYRTFWENEVEGSGKLPFLGGAVKPDVLNLRSGGDAALYLAYQELLVKEIATAFCLDPSNLGDSKGTSRDASESAADRDWDHAIRPMASLVAAYINREVIADRLGFTQIELGFRGLDRKDEKAQAEILQTLYQINALTPNDVREQLGMPPSSNYWSNLCKADVDIATMAARGTGLVDDGDLPALDQVSDTKLADQTPVGAPKVKLPVPRSKQGPTPAKFLPPNPLKSP